MGALIFLALISGMLARLALRGDRRRWRWFAAFGAGAACALSLAAAGTLYWYHHRIQPAPAREVLFHGVTYIRDVRQSPRPMVIHVATIDLRADGVRFLVTPPALASGHEIAARKTSGFLEEFKLQLAINANYFYPFKSESPWDYYPHVGDGADVCGIAASQGRVYGNGRWKDGTLHISADNRASFDEPIGPVYNAISGNGLLVKDGAAQLLPAGGDDDPYPRAALALDRDAARLLLFVIDGKQPGYSEGATLAELCRVMIEHGAYTGTRLDEGGSSTLVRAGAGGRAVTLNSTINNRIPYRERPVANHLGVYARPAP